MERGSSDLDLPGFRFHPTEEELLEFYLRRAAYRKELTIDIIGTLNLYRHDPWELPKLAKIGEREWYFFVPRDRRQANGGRPNRTTERGFWKATGSDRLIRSAVDPKQIIGLKKTLVFYTGRAPRGCKTEWVMNEYRLPDASPSSAPKEDIVLCKVYRKATPLRELEQRAAMEEEARASQGCASMADTVSSSDQENFMMTPTTPFDEGEVIKEKEEVPKEAEVVLLERDPKFEDKDPKLQVSSTSSRSVNLPELQVPKYGLDWMHDSFLTQLRSPWLEQWSPYANILNF